jgi:transcriptional regulator with XRE-family HTH domain
VVALPGLRRLRTLAALSQADLAERAGVQRQTINRLEHGGDAQPSTVRKLAAALNCRPRDLIEPSDLH